MEFESTQFVPEGEAMDLIDEGGFFSCEAGKFVPGLSDEGNKKFFQEVDMTYNKQKNHQL